MYGATINHASLRPAILLYCLPLLPEYNHHEQLAAGEKEARVALSKRIQRFTPLDEGASFFMAFHYWRSKQGDMACKHMRGFFAWMRRLLSVAHHASLIFNFTTFWRLCKCRDHAWIATGGFGDQGRQEQSWQSWLLKKKWEKKAGKESNYWKNDTIELPKQRISGSSVVELWESVYQFVSWKLIVELATDAKIKYRDKSVSLIHSRDRLLSRFHPATHAAILPRLKELGIKVHLNQRPQLPEQRSQQSITLSTGKILAFDLLVRLNHTSLIVDFMSRSHPKLGTFKASISILNRSKVRSNSDPTNTSNYRSSLSKYLRSRRCCWNRFS